MTTRSELLIEIPTSAPGTRRCLKTIRFGDPSSRPKIYIQAALHANEVPGILVLHYLDQLLTQADVKGEIAGHVILVPMANPLGSDQRLFGNMIGRYSLSNGLNFNRGYPDLAEQAAKIISSSLTDNAEQNSQMFRDALVSATRNLTAQDDVAYLKRTLLELCIDADVCLDLHCDMESLLHLYTADVCWDRAQSLSTLLGCKCAFVCELAGGNPFDEAVSIPWVDIARKFPAHPFQDPPLSATIELRGQSDVSEELASHDALNLFAFMQHEGIVAGEPNLSQETACTDTPLSGVDYVRSPGSGVVIHRKEVGDYVDRGDVIAHLHDPFGNNGHQMIEITTRASGIVFTRTNQRMVSFGQQIVAVAGNKPLLQRGSTLLSD